MCFFDKNLSVEPQFYDYSSVHDSSIITSLTHYGSYRTVIPFDPPTQNIISYINTKTTIVTTSHYLKD